MTILLLLACEGQVVDTGNDDADQDQDGFVLSEDCHDRDAEVFPGATEDCDGVDDDCDGLVDEGTTVLIYEDLDGDGFGDVELGEGCLDEGVEVGGDCDDSLAEVNPDATEVCNDGLDNDCNGLVECRPEGELSADATFVGSAEDEELGGPLRGVGDLDGDGGAELALSARGADGPAGENTGAIYFYAGAPTGEHEPSIDADAVVHGLSEDDALYGVWGLGDGQVAVSSRVAADGAGQTWVLAGPLSGTLDLGAYPSLVGVTGSGSGVLAPALDANGDGSLDLAISAPSASTVWIAHGPFSGESSLADAPVTVQGSDPAEQVGGGLTATDLDGDGISELVLGAPYRGDGGEVLVFAGPLSGLLSPDDATAVLSGAADDEAGWALSPAQDHDGDGYGDLLASATRSDAGATDAGAVYLVRGPLSGASLLSDAHASFLGANEDDHLAPNHGDGDVDGDGGPDVVLGCRNCGEAGAAWLFYGPVTGTSTLAEADAWLTEGTAGDAQGSPVHMADLDGDGRSDWLIGARSQGGGAGGALLFYGQGL